MLSFLFMPLSLPVTTSATADTPVYAQAMGDKHRGKQLAHAVPKSLAVAKTSPVEPCAGGGSCTYVTQLLMGTDESMFARWDSINGVSVHDATTLEALYSVPGTADHSCFSIDSRNSVLWVLQPGSNGQLQVTNFNLSKTGATKIASTASPVDEWKTKSGATRYAATCFDQGPQVEARYAPLYVSQANGKMFVRRSHYGVPDQELTPPAGCTLNASIGEPLGGLADSTMALYMSCTNALPTQLVAYGGAWDVSKPMVPMWQKEVGFLDRTFSDYRFVGASRGNVVLYQNAEAKVVGALDADTGKERWTKSTDGNADGVLAANSAYAPNDTALIFTALNATVAAVDPDTGDEKWTTNVLTECGAQPSAKVFQMEAMVTDTGGALMLAWLSTGANCLLEVEAGETAQMIDLGTSILPPNAANLLVTKDGGVIAYLGSPGRLVRLEAGATAAAAAA